MNLRKDLVLIRRPGKVIKPEKLQVMTEDCESNWLIRLRKEDGSTIIMPKGTIHAFYEEAGVCHQIELFKKPKSRLQRLKEKYLKTPI